MRELVAAIKEALKTDPKLKGYVKGGVFVSATTQYLPNTSQNYAIGIVPGKDDRTERPGDLIESKPTVQIVAWVAMANVENAVMGTGHSPGILAMTEDIDAVLDTKDMGGCEWGFCASFTQPKVFGHKRDHGKFLVQRILTYSYEQEVTR